jgi:hypothetical protein
MRTGDFVVNAVKLLRPHDTSTSPRRDDRDLRSPAGLQDQPPGQDHRRDLRIPKLRQQGEDTPIEGFAPMMFAGIEVA